MRSAVSEYDTHELRLIAMFLCLASAKLDHELHDTGFGTSYSSTLVPSTANRSIWCCRLRFGRSHLNPIAFKRLHPVLPPPQRSRTAVHINPIQLNLAYDEDQNCELTYRYCLLGFAGNEESQFVVVEARGYHAHPSLL